MCSAAAFARIKMILLVHIDFTISLRTDLVHLTYASDLQSTLYNDLLFADVLSLAV